MIKPPYSVPTMEEIAALPWNGFNAVSTFSGCGGSSLGDRMAGFRMLWASEFIPAAQETYRANCAPYTILDTRDIREVTGADILGATGLEVGEIDLFDGSPPCASFSTNGNRDKDWGKVKKYSNTTQRTDDLFFEYARLIRDTQPRTFVAENVAGLIKGTAKGYFKLILAELKGCGYKVSARVVNAAWLGVPQTRNRLILVGVREDLELPPVHPRPLPYQYGVSEIMPYIAAMGDRDRPRKADGPAGAIFTSPTKATKLHGPSGQLIQTPDSDLVTHDPETGNDIRVIHDTGGTFRSLAKGDVSDSQVPPITTHNHTHFAVGTGEPITVDPETGENISIVGFAVGREWARLRPGERSDKYFSVRRELPDRPASVIMANAGGASHTGINHWAEPRKFTLGELRAISGFPADFELTGSYSQRWERIGRAVPPVMMSHIAAAIRDGVLVPLREAGTI